MRARRLDLAKLHELRDRWIAGELWSIAVIIRFFFEDRGRSCLALPQIADAIGCSLTSVKNACRKLRAMGRLVALEEVDDELASYRQRANGGLVLWRVYVPPEHVIHNNMPGGGQQPDLSDLSSGEVISSSSSNPPDLDQKQHRRSTAPGDPCTCATCAKFRAIADLPAPAVARAPVSNPPRFERVPTPATLPGPVVAPAPRQEAATRAGSGSDPVVIPKRLLAALAREHGRVAVRGIVGVLGWDECRQDPWCTLAAARVLAARQADNPVGSFVSLVRKALDGEPMDDPRVARATEQAELAAVAGNPELAGEGVGVRWGELGVFDPDGDDDDPPPARSMPFESRWDYLERVRREAVEARADREAQLARAELDAKYSDAFCDRLDRDEPVCSGSPDHGQGEPHARAQGRRDRARKTADLRARYRGVPLGFLPTSRTDRAARRRRGLPRCRAGPLP